MSIGNKGNKTPNVSTRFKKGQSGNPSGLKREVHEKLQEVSRYAQQFSVEAVEGLMEIARNVRNPAMARVVAFNSVLDRAHGKPAQAVDLSNKDGSLAGAWAAAREAIEQEEAEAVH